MMQQQQYRRRRWPPSQGTARIRQPVNKSSSSSMQQYQNQHILRHIHAHPLTFLQGASGCGKSSGVPHMILEDATSRGETVRVVATQPTSIAAASLARYVASRTKGALVPQELGYGVTGSADPDNCQLLYVTTSSLLQWLSCSETAVQEITHLILDEVHDRSIDQDLLFLLLKLKLGTGAVANCSMKLIIMSATLELAPLQKYFSFLVDGQTCNPIVVNETKVTSPVKIIYAEDLLQELPSLSARGSELVNRLIDFPATGRNVPRFLFDLVEEIILHQASAGDVFLIFMPGLADINELQWRLFKRFSASRVPLRIQLLHSFLSQQEQEQVLEAPPPLSTNVIISTNIAESSITIPKINYIIDLGIEKVVYYNSKRGVNVLINRWCSRASLKQRAGRAARDQGSGLVIRFFTRKIYEELLEYTEPEVKRSCLERPVLKIKSLLSSFGLADVLIQQMLDPPSVDNLRRSLESLNHSGAIHVQPDGDFLLMPVGRLAAKLSLNLHVSRLIILGLLLGCSVDCVVMAAGLTLSVDIFQKPYFKSSLSRCQQDRLRYFRARKFYDKDMHSDMIVFCNIYHHWMQNGWDEQWISETCLNPGSLKLFVQRVKTLAGDVASFMKDEGLTEPMKSQYCEILHLTKGDTSHSGLFHHNVAMVMLTIAGAFSRHVMIGNFSNSSMAQSESVEIKNAGLDACHTFKLSELPAEAAGDVGSLEKSLQVLGPISKVLVANDRTALVECPTFIREQECTTFTSLPEAAQAAYFLASQEKANDLILYPAHQTLGMDKAANLGKPTKCRQICWSTFLRGQRHGVSFDHYSSLLRSLVEVHPHFQFHIAVAADFLGAENIQVHVSNVTVLPSGSYFSVLALLLFRSFQTILIRTDPAQERVYSLQYGPLVFHWVPQFILLHQLHHIERVRASINTEMSGNGLCSGCIQEDIQHLLDWMSFQTSCEPHLNPDIGSWIEYPSLKPANVDNPVLAWKLNLVSEPEPPSDDSFKSKGWSSKFHSGTDLLVPHLYYREKSQSCAPLKDSEEQALLKSFKLIEPDLHKQLLEDWIDGSKHLNLVFYSLLEQLVADNSHMKQVCIILKFMHKRRCDLVPKKKQMELEGWYHTLCNAEHVDVTSNSVRRAPLAQKVHLQKHHAVQGWASIEEGYLPMVSKNMNLTADQIEKLKKGLMNIKSQVSIVVPRDTSLSDNVIVSGHPREVEGAVRWIDIVTDERKAGKMWKSTNKTYFSSEDLSHHVSCIDLGQLDESDNKSATLQNCHITFFCLEGMNATNSNLKRSGTFLDEITNVVKSCLLETEKSAEIELQARLGRVIFSCQKETRGALPFIKSQPLGEVMSAFENKRISKQRFHDTVTKQDFFFVRACLKLYKPECIHGESKVTLFLADPAHLRNHYSVRKMTFRDCVDQSGTLSFVKVQHKEKLAVLDIVQLRAGPIKADIRLTVHTLKEEEEAEDSYRMFASKVQRDGAVIKFPRGPYDVTLQRIKTCEHYYFDGFYVSLNEITQVEGRHSEKKYEIEISPLNLAKSHLSVCDVLGNLTGVLFKILEQAGSIINELALNQPSSSCTALAQAILCSWKIWGDDLKIKDVLLEHINQDIGPSILSEIGIGQKQKKSVSEFDISNLVCSLVEILWHIDGAESNGVNLSETLLQSLFRCLRSMSFSLSVTVESRARGVIARKGFPPKVALMYASIFRCYCSKHERWMKILGSHLLELKMDRDKIIEEHWDVDDYVDDAGSHLSYERIFFGMQRQWCSENPGCFFRLYTLTCKNEYLLSGKEVITKDFVRRLLCKHHFKAAAFVLNCASHYINGTKGSKACDQRHIASLIWLLDQIKNLNVLVTEDCRFSALEMLVNLDAADGSLLQEIEKRIFKVYEVDEAMFRHIHYQKILSGSLTLKTVHLEELKRRGLTENACQSMNFKTWASGKHVLSSCLVPGLNKEGNYLIGSPGIFIPARDPSGQITGAQIKPDKVSSGKYKWLSSNKVFEGGRGPSLNGELPLFCCVPLGKDTSIIGMCEGGLKAHVLSSLAALPVIGASGAAFPQSRNLLERYLATMNPDHILFFPDAGSQCNDQVSRSYFQTFRLVRELGYYLLIAWWGQVDKVDHQDIDDLLCNSLSTLHIPVISPTEFWHVLNPAVRNKLSREFPEFSGSYELKDLQDTFIDDDSIKISRIVSGLQHVADRSPLNTGFLVSIPKSIMACMPSAPNDMVTPASVQEFTIDTRMVEICHADCVDSCIEWLLQDSPATRTCLGFSCKYGLDFSPCLIQLSVHQRCLLIRAPSKMDHFVKPMKLESILRDKNIIKAGADIDKDALYIFHHLQLTTNSCVKIHGHFTRQRWKEGLQLMFRKLFKWDWCEKKQIVWSYWGGNHMTLEQIKFAVLGAWSSRLIWVCQQEMRNGEAPIFSLDEVPQQLLEYFQRSLLNSDKSNRQESTPIEMTGASLELQQGYLTLQQSNFRSRVLGSKSTVEITFKDGQQPEKYETRMRRGSKVVLGRKASSNDREWQENSVDVNLIAKLSVDNSRNSDMQKQKLQDAIWFLLCNPRSCSPHILMALGCVENNNNAFQEGQLARIGLPKHSMGLNHIQIDAWRTILSNPLSAVIGPPGTGKTTLIVAVAKTWHSLAAKGETLLCAAHQNVAVRNMAETMMKQAIQGVMLLISQDFYVDWHEQDYTHLQDSVVVSGSNIDVAFKNWIGRNKRQTPRILLCTLAVIGSQSFDVCLTNTKITSMIIDECSQTSEASLIPTLICLPHLQMLSILGDPFQLPPFGKEVQSVFDLVAKSCKVVVLRFQYRMPKNIADFVSSEFYSGVLFTPSKQGNKIGPKDYKSLVWVNVNGSAELADGSTSLCNKLEANAITKFCMEYKTQAKATVACGSSPVPLSSSSSSGSGLATGKQGKLVVLTLYEAQRLLISNNLQEAKVEGIPVCNVDSFQGQEAEDVVISLAVGERMSPFAGDRRRACVLLSRARHFLYVFGNLDAVKACRNSMTASNAPSSRNIWQSLAHHCEQHLWVAEEKDTSVLALSMFQQPHLQ